MKNKNLSAKKLVSLEEGEATWDIPAKNKNDLLIKIGRGEDLLLTHLAKRIAEFRPI